MLVHSAVECQSKTLLDSMEGRQFWKRKTCAIHKEHNYPCLAVIHVVSNTAVYKDEFAAFMNLYLSCGMNNK